MAVVFLRLVCLYLCISVHIYDFLSSSKGTHLPWQGSTRFFTWAEECVWLGLLQQKCKEEESTFGSQLLTTKIEFSRPYFESHTLLRYIVGIPYASNHISKTSPA